MRFFVRFGVTQPDTVPNADLVEIWKREAVAALGAKEAGAVTHLPIIREMGAGVRTEALPIYPYETFADHLNEGVHGP